MEPIAMVIFLQIKNFLLTVFTTFSLSVHGFCIPIVTHKFTFILFSLQQEQMINSSQRRDQWLSAVWYSS